jgi:CO/xanthine dehydrogenase Mo-binding subunit
LRLGIRRAALITSLLSKGTGRPVRSVNTHRNDYDVASPQRYMRLKTGFMNDGALTAAQDTVVADAGVRGTSFFEDVILDYDPKALFTPVGGGSDGSTASAWVAKECVGD